VPWEAPTADHLKSFIGIMDALADKKVLVHCQVNARVSAFMLKYLTFKGVSEAEATTPLMVKWKPQMDDTWKAFLALSKQDVA
jgi:rhodanese-related sulfurtransferase